MPVRTDLTLEEIDQQSIELCDKLNVAMGGEVNSAVALIAVEKLLAGLLSEYADQLGVPDGAVMVKSFSNVAYYMNIIRMSKAANGTPR